MLSRRPKYDDGIYTNALSLWEWARVRVSNIMNVYPHHPTFSLGEKEHGLTMIPPSLHNRISSLED